MKKLFFVFIFFVFSSFALAEEPKHTNSLNENIKKLSWKLVSTKSVKMKDYPAEINTLTRFGYVLKCVIIYYPHEIDSYCETP